MLGRLPAGSPSVAIRSFVVATAGLAFALAGAASAQQVQWYQSPINGHWYGAEYSNRTWTDSEGLAVSMGGHLVTIRSQAEQDWIQNTFGFANGTVSGLWMGFNDVASEGNWVWSSGEVSTYSNWAPGEPNQLNPDEDFGEIYPLSNPNAWRWNDAAAPAPVIRALVEVPALPARSWSWPTGYATGLHPHYGCLADLDGDGDLDYASPALDAGQISIFLNDGHGAFALSQTLTVGGRPVTVVAIDLDGDHDLDLAATDLDGRLLSLLNDGSSGFGSQAQIAAVPVAHGLAIGDMNNDGLSDLIVTSAGSDSRIRVFLAQQGGGFQLGQTVDAIFAEDFYCTVADFNGDGYLDLALSGSGIGILRGSASGILTFAGELGIGGAGRAAAADLDGDGDVDLLVPRSSGTVAEVWTNNGSGGMTNTQVVVTGSGANWAEAADLDGDGDLDVVLSNRPVGTLSVLNNNGQGVFSVDATLVSPGTPFIALARDLNGDGKPDILSGDPTGNQFLVTINQSIFDCNGNGIDDPLDLQSGAAQDCDGNLRPDSCDIAFGSAADCNANGIPDSCDIASAQSQDCNGNGVPDECEIVSGQSDCDSNGLLDACEIAANPSLDLDHNGILDRCQDAGTPYCFGDGSGHTCPCDPGQIGSTGHGCANSSGEGAILNATGVCSVTGDDLQLHVANMPNPSSVLFFQGTVQQGSGQGSFNGDGLLCVNGPGGNLIRLGIHAGQPGSSSFGAGIGTDPLISVRGQIPAIGGTRYYQAWYRDNSSFCTPAVFNFSNGLAIVWTP